MRGCHKCCWVAKCVKKLFYKINNIDGVENIPDKGWFRIPWIIILHRMIFKIIITHKVIFRLLIIITKIWNNNKGQKKTIQKTVINLMSLMNQVKTTFTEIVFVSCSNILFRFVYFYSKCFFSENFLVLWLSNKKLLHRIESNDVIVQSWLISRMV